MRLFVVFWFKCLDPNREDRGERNVCKGLVRESFQTRFIADRLDAVKVVWVLRLPLPLRPYHICHSLIHSFTRSFSLAVISFSARCSYLASDCFD